MSAKIITMNYLDLLKLALTGALNTYGEYKPKFFKGEVFRWWSLLYWLDLALRRFGYNICTYTPYDVEKRINGQDHPMYADTMCGGKRLTTIAWITKEVINNRVKGDFLMAGAWRGGAAIYMKAVLKYFFDKRFVFVADSFMGLPKPTLKEDKGDTLWQVGYLAVDLETVRANFRKYDLLDKSVVFLKGWLNRINSFNYEKNNLL